jgi:hypothetical protein
MKLLPPHLVVELALLATACARRRAERVARLELLADAGRRWSLARPPWRRSVLHLAAAPSSSSTSPVRPKPPAKIGIDRRGGRVVLAGATGLGHELSGVDPSTIVGATCRATARRPIRTASRAADWRSWLAAPSTSVR